MDTTRGFSDEGNSRAEGLTVRKSGRDGAIGRHLPPREGPPVRSTRFSHPLSKPFIYSLRLILFFVYRRRRAPHRTIR